MRLRNVSPRGDLRVTGHGHVPFGAEFDVLKEHVGGLIHQAFGEDKNFEPADGEAQQAVAAAQQAAPEPEIASASVSPDELRASQGMSPAPVPAPMEPPAPETPAQPDEENQ